MNTLDHLGELGIREPRLERLLVAVGAFFAKSDQVDVHAKRTRSTALVRECQRVSCRLRRMKKGDRRRFTHRVQLDALKSPVHQSTKG